MDQLQANDALTGEETIVTLFSAQTQENEPFYCYIELTLNKFAEFLEGQEQGVPADFTQMGTIIATGWGENPPIEVQQEMQDKYGDKLQNS